MKTTIATQVKDFVKEHKTEIVCVAGCVGLFGLGWLACETKAQKGVRTLTDAVYVGKGKVGLMNCLEKEGAVNKFLAAGDKWILILRKS